MHTGVSAQDLGAKRALHICSRIPLSLTHSLPESQLVLAQNSRTQEAEAQGSSKKGFEM